MRSSTFRKLMGDAENFGHQLAAFELKRPVFQTFGTTDRERCIKEAAAFCGVRIYSNRDVLEIWYCIDNDGTVYGSDDIEDAHPFPICPTPEDIRQAVDKMHEFMKSLKGKLKGD